MACMTSLPLTIVRLDCFTVLSITHHYFDGVQNFLLYELVCYNSFQQMSITSKGLLIHSDLVF